ncbi:MAG TPA: hypothetical protein PLG38_08055, partial [Propionibacteriaceae bacterium]|nr:hypothetical protein [Propionibacteriaceae bacterium]
GAVADDRGVRGARDARLRRPGLGKLNEIVRIPVIEYVLAILLAWLIVGGRWLVRRFRTSKPTPAGAEVAA